MHRLGVWGRWDLGCTHVCDRTHVSLWRFMQTPELKGPLAVSLCLEHVPAVPVLCKHCCESLCLCMCVVMSFCVRGSVYMCAWQSVSLASVRVLLYVSVCVGPSAGTMQLTSVCPITRVWACPCVSWWCSWLHPWPFVLEPHRRAASELVTPVPTPGPGCCSQASARSPLGKPGALGDSGSKVGPLSIGSYMVPSGGFPCPALSFRIREWAAPPPCCLLQGMAVFSSTMATTLEGTLCLSMDQEIGESWGWVACPLPSLNPAS